MSIIATIIYTICFIHIYIYIIVLQAFAHVFGVLQTCRELLLRGSSMSLGFIRSSCFAGLRIHGVGFTGLLLGDLV